MRLIDAYALMAEMHNIILEDGEDRRTFYEVIERQPTIEPQRMRGKWVEVNDNYNRISGKCSVCGWESHMYEDDVVGMNFCPNCGCQMNGDEEDEQ